jgi:hypothetical protein
MPYFCELLLFYKIRYWKYSFQNSPVLFIAGKGGVALLLLLIVVQIFLGYMLSPQELVTLRHLSFFKIFLSGWALNLSRLFYFPGACQKDIKKGVYFLYPVSGYDLNNMRILESLFSLSFLLCCNLWVLPAFAWYGRYGILFGILAFFQQLLALLAYDVVIWLFSKIYFLALSFIFLLAMTFLLRNKVFVLVDFLQASSSTAIMGYIPGILLASGIIYLLDTRIFIFTNIKKLPNG